MKQELMNAVSPECVALLQATIERENPEKLPVPIGIDEGGTVLFQNMNDIPHMLICGTTGSGKTEFVRSLLSVMAALYGPEEFRLAVFDSKQIDYGDLNGLPHLLVPVINDRRRASGMLGWLTSEVRRRLTVRAQGLVEPMPEIFVVLDDFAELSADRDCLNSMATIIENGRAVGVHCIVVTASASAKVISTVLKSHIQCRAAFATASKLDSRIILDMNGAEKLHLPGEMIFRGPNMLQICRSLYIAPEDKAKLLESRIVEETVDEETIRNISENANRINERPPVEEAEEEDEMFAQAVSAVLDAGAASTAILQRRLRLAYSRAGRLIDEMEARGIIGPHEGSHPRRVLITRQQWLERNRYT